MSVTRDSLRSRSQAEKDFYAPMTKGTDIRYAAAPQSESRYGSQARGRLDELRNFKRRPSKRFAAIKTRAEKTADPYSKPKFIEPDKPKQESDTARAVREFASGAQDAFGRAQDAVSEGITQYESDRKSTADQIKGVSESFDKRYSADKAERDKYRAAEKAERDKYRQSTSSQIRGVSEAFDKRYAVDKAERDKQYSTLQSDIKSVKTQVSTVGTQLGEVKKQVTTANTPKKAVEVATKAKEEKPTPTKKGGGSKYVTVQSRAKRTARQNKAKALAKKRLAKKKTGGRGFGRSVGRAGRRGGSAGTRGSRSRGATGSASRRSVSRSRRSNTSRSRRSGRSTSSRRGGVSRGRRGRRGGRRGRRGGRRCDLRCKVNISLLTSMNLMRDDLAEVAYFVKELQEIN